MKKKRISFDQWMERVDQWLQCHAGIGIDDIEAPYAIWFQDGIGPSLAGFRARLYEDGSY